MILKTSTYSYNGKVIDRYLQLHMSKKVTLLTSDLSTFNQRKVHVKNMNKPRSRKSSTHNKTITAGTCKEVSRRHKPIDDVLHYQTSANNDPILKLYVPMYQFA